MTAFKSQPDMLCICAIDFQYTMSQLVRSGFSSTLSFSPKPRVIGGVLERLCHLIGGNGNHGCKTLQVACQVRSVIGTFCGIMNLIA